MAGSVITIGVGGAGSRLAVSFFAALRAELASPPTATDTPFFHRTSGGQVVPRLVLADTDPLEATELGARVSSSATPVQVHPTYRVRGRQGASRSFARAYRGRVDTKLPEILDRVARWSDTSPTDAFMVFHSLGGGTGSGLGARVVEELRRHYKNRLIVTVSLMPSVDVLGSPMDPLNAALALYCLRPKVDLSLLADNDALRQRTGGARMSRLDDELADSLANWALPIQEGLTSVAELDKKLALDAKCPYLMVSRARSGSTTISSNLVETALGPDGALASYPSVTYTRKLTSSVLVWRGPSRAKDLQPLQKRVSSEVASGSPGTVVMHTIARPPKGGHALALHAFTGHLGIADLIEQRIQTPFLRLLARGLFIDGLEADGVDHDFLISAGQRLDETIQEYRSFGS